MIVKLIPIEQLLAKISDDLNLGDRDIPVESMIEWIYSGLRRIGAYDQFESKTTRLKIKDYVAELPADFYRVDEVKFMEPHKIGHNILTVGFKTGSLELAYLAMPVDIAGYPLIPEDETYQEALLWLVASKLALRGELTNKELSFEYCDARWKRFMLSARAEANMPNLQFMQKIANNQRQLKYSTNPLVDKFKTLGKEINRR